MILKMHAFLCDLAQLRQRKNLVAAAVGQDRAVPIHEFMQSTEMFNHIETWADKQVISVPENDLRVYFAQFAWTHRFHGTLRSHWHERRRVDRAVRGRPTTSPCFSLSILCEKFKHAVILSESEGPRKSSQRGLKLKLFTFARNDESGCKIFFAASYFPSIFRAHRIRRVTV